MDLEKTFMLREIAMQADFVRDNLDEMLATVRASLANIDPSKMKRGFIIGCGDSYFASLAVREFMMQATGLFVEPVEALEFSRYLVQHLPSDAFVFGVSNSGTVSRTIEGVKLARERGAKTFAVTVSPDSNLAKAAETLVKVNAVPNIKIQADGTRITTPGTLSYTASLLGLYIASIVLGERNGNLKAADVERLVGELRSVADRMSEAEGPISKVAEDVAASFKRDRQFVIAGGGPNYATAHFGAAKWLEALSKASHVAQLEEWAHIQYFMTDDTVDTVILLPPGVGRDRGLEQASAAREMGSRVIIIGEAGDQAAIAASDIFFPMPAGVAEVYTPFLYKLATEYLSCHVAIQQNRRFFGFDNAKREEVNHRQIFHSAQTAAAK